MYFFIKKILFILIFTGIIAGESNIAFARWATYHDAPIQIENTKRTLYINKEGISNEIYEIRAKLLTENKKANWENYSYSYNSFFSTVKILEAYTLNNGKKYKVNFRKIKKQHIPYSIRYRDEQTELIVPYPHLQIGSIVYLKCKLKDLTNPLDNFYSTYFQFGNQCYTHSASVHVSSELPLYLSINDPDKVLNIKQSTQKKNNKTLYCLEIDQNKPIYKHIIDEDKIHFNLKYVPLVAIAAMPSLTHYEKINALKYTEIKNQPLPVLYQKIAKIAQKKNTVIQKIDTVTALLHNNITYLINPKYGFLPQDLQKVVDTRYGDCKDFSMATCVILQRLGIASKIALVRNGEMEQPFPSTLPSHGINHAILKVELPQGPLWIDSTYPVGMAKYIPANVANRKALVLHENYATYENIPSIKSEDYRLIKRETWQIKDASKMHIKGTLQLLGGVSSDFIGKKNNLSDAEIKNMLLSSFIGKEHEILKHDIVLPDLRSRIIEDLIFNYSLVVKNPTLKTAAGNIVPISFKNASLLMTTKDAVSPLYLGPPRIYETYITLENILPSEENDVVYHLESPWVNLTRTINYQKNKDQVIMHRKMEVKKSWIEDTELQSDAYKQLQLGISQNFTNNIPITFELKKN